MTTLIIAAALVAGALGALLRYGITRAYRDSPARLPLAVLVVNVSGSAVAGIAVAASSGDPGSALSLIVVSGFAGGLTTFSTFGVETVQLALDGRWRAAIGSVAANVVGGCAAFVLAWGYVTVFVVTASLGL